MEAYKGRIKSESVQLSNRSVPEIMDFVGQDFVVPENLDFTPLFEKVGFTLGDKLLLGCAHVTKSLEESENDPELKDNENVLAALERGLFNCRKWRPTTPWDVCAFVIDNSNAYHDGLEITFVQIVQKHKELKYQRSSHTHEEDSRQ